MRMYDLIEKKKKGEKLNGEEIEFIVKGYTEGVIKDYQMSALLMAIYFQGMDKEETRLLTMAMARSGDMLDLSRINGIKVDKHSTGGVGDKTTLIVAPLVASLGIPVAKMSGRGLGHTGGTIDKLEAIKGFSTAISEDKFINNVNAIKLAIAGQTANLAPADKKIYALRDVTATVDNISLIASSIMSKKIASGANAIVLDVKVGSGAFMKDTDHAFRLAEEMVGIGSGLSRDTVGIISDMDQPLGNTVGNALEVMEAIETLKGNGPSDLVEISILLGSYMLFAAKRINTIEEGKELLQKSIENGDAFRKFKEFIQAQGGDVSVIDEPMKMIDASIIQPVYIENEGYVESINAEEIGFATMMIGGGRETKESVIDLSVGYVINKKVGDFVRKDEPIATIYGNDEAKVIASKERFVNAYTISADKVEKEPFIKGIVTKDGTRKFTK